jgi:hypothetical protein
MEKKAEYQVKVVTFKNERKCLNMKETEDCQNKTKKGYYIDLWKETWEERKKMSQQERKKEGICFVEKNYWCCAECLAELLATDNNTRIQFIR